MYGITFALTHLNLMLEEQKFKSKFEYSVKNRKYHCTLSVFDVEDKLLQTVSYENTHRAIAKRGAANKMMFALAESHQMKGSEKLVKDIQNSIDHFSVLHAKCSVTEYSSPHFFKEFCRSNQTAFVEVICVVQSKKERGYGHTYHQAVQNASAKMIDRLFDEIDELENVFSPNLSEKSFQELLQMTIDQLENGWVRTKMIEKIHNKKQNINFRHTDIYVFDNSLWTPILGTTYYLIEMALETMSKEAGKSIIDKGFHWTNGFNWSNTLTLWIERKISGTLDEHFIKAPQLIDWDIIKCDKLYEHCSATDYEFAVWIPFNEKSRCDFYKNIPWGKDVSDDIIVAHQATKLDDIKNTFSRPNEHYFVSYWTGTSQNKTKTTNEVPLLLLNALFRLLLSFYKKNDLANTVVQSKFLKRFYARQNIGNFSRFICCFLAMDPLTFFRMIKEPVWYMFWIIVALILFGSKAIIFVLYFFTFVVLNLYLKI